MRLFTVGSSEVRRPEGLAQLVLGLHGDHGIQVLCRWMKQTGQTFTLDLSSFVMSGHSTMNENLLTV